MIKNIEMLNQIFNEDGLEGMKRIEDKSIDMILCDLPYGTTKCKWDTVIPFIPLWEQYNRIIKDNGAIVLTAQTPFDKVLGVSNLKDLRYEWIWKKGGRGTGFLNSKKMPLKNHENILVFYKKLPTYNPQMTQGEPYTRKRGPNEVSVKSPLYGDFAHISTGSEGERFPISIIDYKMQTGLHPTQKPVLLLEYLIKTYTNEGETVMDNCMGSGSTAIAAINTNRNYIGFELDTIYYENSIERINQHNLNDAA